MLLQYIQYYLLRLPLDRVWQYPWVHVYVLVYWYSSTTSSTCDGIRPCALTYRPAQTPHIAIQSRPYTCTVHVYRCEYVHTSHVKLRTVYSSRYCYLAIACTAHKMRLKSTRLDHVFVVGTEHTFKRVRFFLLPFFSFRTSKHCATCCSFWNQEHCDLLVALWRNRVAPCNTDHGFV